jgi:hypothetical protein
MEAYQAMLFKSMVYNFIRKSSPQQIERVVAFGSKSKIPSACDAHSCSTMAAMLEIHIKRALGDAGGARDVVYAGGIKALGEEHHPGALDDLTPFYAVVFG